MSVIVRHPLAHLPTWEKKCALEGAHYLRVAVRICSKVAFDGVNMLHPTLLRFSCLSSFLFVVRFSSLVRFLLVFPLRKWSPESQTLTSLCFHTILSSRSHITEIERRTDRWCVDCCCCNHPFQKRFPHLILWQFCPVVNCLKYALYLDGTKGSAILQQ